MDAALIDEVKAVLGGALGIGERAAAFDVETALLGVLPELDSIAVVAVIASLEAHFGVTVHDDEISASTFETVGSLTRFVESKIR